MNAFRAADLIPAAAICHERREGLRRAGGPGAAEGKRRRDEEKAGPHTRDHLPAEHATEQLPLLGRGQAQRARQLARPHHALLAQLQVREHRRLLPTQPRLHDCIVFHADGFSNHPGEIDVMTYTAISPLIRRGSNRPRAARSFLHAVWDQVPLTDKLRGTGRTRLDSSAVADLDLS